MQQPVNPWTYKPWWCQPWSIVLTGILLISGSWLLTNTLWVSVLVALPVLVWMGFFLFIWPQLMIRSGLLDQYQQPVQNSLPEE
jgi:hypothetical protein